LGTGRTRLTSQRKPIQRRLRAARKARNRRWKGWLLDWISQMPDNHYENPRLAEIYDLDSPWSVDRDFYLSLANKPRQRILDLGCGTGLLCNAYAAMDHDVTGVDPSSAMLDVARRKACGNEIEWVQSSAQMYRSDKLFDLIITTGHAFQVLLTDADIKATFAVMRKHLKPSGFVVFETRNPVIGWESKWNYDMVLETRGGHVHESRRFLSIENERMKFQLRYQFPDEILVSESQLRFLSRKSIEERLIASELRADKVFGDWNGTPFDEQSSQEIIFIARPAT
jgi:2-polyprenyl-3-methyl-5-hydroxy-6-metoxy-1,4-benzoquinol methylase